MKKFSLCLLLFCLGIISANSTKIALLADLHVTPGNPNEEKLKDVVAELNSSDCEIVILAGDLTNEGSDEQLSNIKQILDKIKKPFFVIPGNHETTWSQSACKTFSDLWGNDRFITETNDLILIGISCGPYMKMGDGHIKQEDLIWLDHQLAQHKKSGKKVVSINHYPLLPDLDNCNDYIKILEKYPTIVHLCGHYHAFRHYKGGDIDGLINRALDMKKGNYGYTVVEVVNDSVKQWDKQISIAPRLVTAFKINNNLKPITIATEDNNELPLGVTATKVFQDNASIFTRLGVDKNNIYFGNSLGFIKAINKATGKEIWKYKTEAALFSRPAVSDKAIIVPTSDKRLIWIDKNSGKIINNQVMNGPFVADGIIEKGILYQGGYKTFEAWNVKDKNLLWKLDGINNYCQASPVINGNDIFFGAWDTYLRCVNMKTGELKWKWSNGKSANMLGPGNCVPVVTSDKVIIVAPDRYMTAIDRNTGKQIWRNNKYKYRESLGTSKDGKFAYAKTMDGEVVCVSTEGNEFKEIWTLDAKLGYEHAPCIVIENKGIVYVGSRSGIMAAINPKTQKLLWTYRLGTSEFNGWEIDEKGDLYTSLIEGSIWRIATKD